MHEDPGETTQATSVGQGDGAFDGKGYSRRWLELAERRRDYLVELYRSGRWRRYFSEVEFLAVMRGVKAEEEAWRSLATASPEEASKAD